MEAEEFAGARLNFLSGDCTSAPGDCATAGTATHSII